MRSVQEIIRSAYARSKASQEDVSASSDGELRPQLSDILKTFFAIGARVNPEFFSTSEVIAYDAAVGGWPRPTAAEAVWWIANGAGTRVVVVPHDDRDAEPGSPSVYRMGQVYLPTGGALGPAAAVPLTFDYAKVPDAVPELLSEIDQLWPAGHESLLALELAVYLAIKDRRNEDVPGLVQERDRQLQRFIAFLEHETIGERRRKGSVRKFNVQSRVPMGSMLAGGS